MSPSKAAARAASVAAGSSGTIRAPTSSAPARSTSPASECAFELRIAPGRSGPPGSCSSSPVVSTVTRGRRLQLTSDRPTEASTPMPAGSSSVPTTITVRPTSMSSPARRTSLPGGTSTEIATDSAPPSVSSTLITASAPSGSIAPVEIAIASPAPRARAAGCPARDSPTTASRAGSAAVAPVVSAARTA